MSSTCDVFASVVSGHPVIVWSGLGPRGELMRLVMQLPQTRSAPSPGAPRTLPHTVCEVCERDAVGGERWMTRASEVDREWALRSALFASLVS